MQKELLEVMKEEKKMYLKLKQQNLASQREFLTAKRQFLKFKSDWLEFIKKQEKQVQTLNESKSKLKQAIHKHNLSSATRLNEINSELLQAKKNIIKLKNRFNHLVIKSPIDGFVKGIGITESSVISADSTLMEIIPSNSKLVVETKILSTDIGHISTGAKVKLKVSSYDYSRFGMLNGELERISAMTFLDNKTNQIYYKGVIRLNKEYLGKNPQQLRLLPGMLVEADIYTGKKTVLEFLLKPIYNSINNSFIER